MKIERKSGKSLCTGTGQNQTVQLDKRQGSECSTPKQTEMTSSSLTSSGDKIHICSECQKSFGQSGGLKRHMVTHTKERAYNCIQCQRSFGQAAVLKRHMLTHSGSKTHTCSECEKSFNQAANLRTHMLIHYRKKTHNCRMWEVIWTRHHLEKTHDHPYC